MNPLHKALYRSFLNSDSEPDERQERIINAELARCLIYLYWFDIALLLLMVAHDRLEGVFISITTVVLLINIAFIGIFTLTNENCQELQEQKPSITPQNLPQYLVFYKKRAVLSAVFVVISMTALFFDRLALAAYPPLATIAVLFCYGALMGWSAYRHDKKKALKILADKQAATTDSETNKEA